MKDDKKKVCLIFGGRSAEHEISIMSATAIYKNLDKSKFEVTTVYINKEGRWKKVEAFPFSSLELEKGPFSSFLPWDKLERDLALSIDIYFPVLHGPYGEDGTIQGLFEMADVPYVGAAVLGSAAGMDKAVSKTLFWAAGLPVVEHRIILEPEWQQDRNRIIDMIEKEFAPPLFIKPANLGSSIGITKIAEISQLSGAIQTAFLYDRKVIVEAGIQGRELECSVLGNEDPEASLPGEVIPHRDFYDYRDKYIEGRTTFKIPAELPPSKIKEVQQTAVRAFLAIDCSGMARVDFLMEKETGRIFLNEVNTIPGFTEISMYPKLWELSGISFPRLLERLIELGFEKQRDRKKRKKDLLE